MVSKEKFPLAHEVAELVATAEHDEKILKALEGKLLLVAYELAAVMEATKLPLVMPCEFNAAEFDNAIYND